jgi:glycolate oxidase iron-sulfur subunit
VLLPATMQAKIPERIEAAKERPQSKHARKVLMLEGCVQPTLSPNTNAAAARVMDRLGISVAAAPQAGCCGATDYHLKAKEAGLARARRNIDAWWPAIQTGAEAIVMTASGCGAFVKEYGHLLRDDPLYRAKAQRVSELTRDLVEVLVGEPLERLHAATDKRVAFHCPCTLQHAQKLGGSAEAILQRLGFTTTAVASVLRLRGNLLNNPAGTRDHASRQQVESAWKRQPRPDCDCEHRLSGPSSEWLRTSSQALD